VQMVGVETIMTGIMDTWQSLVLHWQYRVLAVIGVCAIFFVLGIPCTTQVLAFIAINKSKRYSLDIREMQMSGMALPRKITSDANITVILLNMIYVLIFLSTIALYLYCLTAWFLSLE